MMMKKYYVLFVMLVGLLQLAFANASNYDYTKIDTHARQAPKKLQTDLEKLTAYLVKPAKNDREKVRSFYVWITENIAYDVQLFRSYSPARYQPMLPSDVVKKGKAVCQGYSELFQEMCRIVGVPSHVVAGYSKGFGYTPRDKFTTADHAWNVVQIDGDWQLVDATWGSGGINEKMKFIKKFHEQYFLTDPKDFVLNHLPLVPMWQLLECPVPMAAYIRGTDEVKEHLLSSGGDCLDFRALIAEYESKPTIDQKLFSAQQAYVFNPDNPIAMARGYMDYANYLMGSIPRKLSSKSTILQAIETQEEAVKYLRKADTLLKQTEDKSADREKQLVATNLRTSEQNLKGLKNAIK